MIKVLTTILGSVLCLTGVIGFFSHSFMQMDLNLLQTSLLLLIGIVSLYFGVQGTEFEARNMCRVLGVVFSVLGVLTLCAGPGQTTTGINITASNMFKLIPGHLEYTTADGLRDLCVGVVAFITGFIPRQKEIEIDMKAHEIKEKVAGKL